VDPQDPLFAHGGASLAGVVPPFSRQHPLPATDDATSPNTGEIVVVGGEVSAPVDLDWRIMRFDSSGGLRWSTVYGSSGPDDPLSPGYRNDLATSVVLDRTGAAVVAGFVSRREGTPHADWCVRRYSDSGSLLNSWTYRRASNWTGTPSGIATTANGDIVIAGYERSFDISSRASWLVLKFAPCTTTPSVESIAAGTVRIVGGIRGYINPRRGEQANILVHPTSAGEVAVSIYDEAGRMIRSITAHYSGSGVESVHWDATNQTGGSVPPGLYHVVVRAPGVNARDTVAVIR